MEISLSVVINISLRGLMSGNVRNRISPQYVLSRGVGDEPLCSEMRVSLRRRAEGQQKLSK